MVEEVAQQPSRNPASTGARETREPIKGVRKMMGQAMVDSAFTAPHVTEWVTVDVTATMQGVARELGMRNADVDITFTSLAMTYQDTPDDIPIVATRQVKQRAIDYEHLTRVDHLVRDVLRGDLQQHRRFGVGDFNGIVLGLSRCASRGSAAISRPAGMGDRSDGRRHWIRPVRTLRCTRCAHFVRIVDSPRGRHRRLIGPRKLCALKRRLVGDLVGHD